MKQRICIGIQELDEGWSAVLDQIGVCYEKVNYDLELAQNYSAIILNETPDSYSVSELHQYMKDGGALVELKGIHPFLHRHHFRKEHIETLFNNTSNENFRHIPYLDLFSEVEFHNEATLFEGLIHFQVWKRGVIGFFGADPSKLIHKTGYKRKRFYSESGFYPDEIVSKVSKHALLQSFVVMLRQLHYRRSLPFVQKWTSPDKKPVFGFRIDTDFADQEAIDRLYQVLHKNKVKGTWFLHVKAHEEWLSAFKDLEDQELALHGYDHGTSKAVSKTRDNISTGQELLQQNNIESDGFCAPYGIWNKALERAISDFNFKYSSEFTFTYDGFPLKPEKPFPIQVPVHPICTGSLSRKRYDEAAMASYFAQVLQRKLGRFEPVIFYHHPLQPGLQVWDHLFKLINAQELTNLTFLEFAEFWNSRAQINFEAVFDGNSVLIESDSASQYFQVSNSQTGFSLVQAGSKSDVKESNDFQYANHYLPDAKQASKLHKMNIRLLKTSFMDWKNRIRL
ncbi:MAG: hypothetical protein CL666_07120 [Balneola sp.]|nr:hypothetical protein [Balneola sp.]|tara:strand:+ start:68094 stop:69620 length:1527 start_codon:yes stop_codon:yes gene_type:complete